MSDELPPDLAAAKPSKPSPRDEGIRGLHAGRLDDAVKHLTEAVELDPRDVTARAQLAAAYSRKGLHKQARVAIQSALEQQPGSAQLLFLAGNVLERAEEWDEATAAYRECLRRDPGHTEAVVRLALFHEKPLCSEPLVRAQPESAITAPPESSSAPPPKSSAAQTDPWEEQHPAIKAVKVVGLLGAVGVVATGAMFAGMAKAALGIPVEPSPSADEKPDSAPAKDRGSVSSGRLSPPAPRELQETPLTPHSTAHASQTPPTSTEPLAVGTADSAALNLHGSPAQQTASAEDVGARARIEGNGDGVLTFQLCSLVKREGAQLFVRPSYLEERIGQLCGTREGEGLALIAAKRSGLLPPLQRIRDRRQLEQELMKIATTLAEAKNISLPLAQWAVDSWALALGYIARMPDRGGSPQAPVWPTADLPLSGFSHPSTFPTRPTGPRDPSADERSIGYLFGVGLKGWLLVGAILLSVTGVGTLPGLALFWAVRKTLFENDRFVGFDNIVKGLGLWVLTVFLIALVFGIFGSLASR